MSTLKDKPLQQRDSYDLKSLGKVQSAAKINSKGTGQRGNIFKLGRENATPAGLKSKTQVLTLKLSQAPPKARQLSSLQSSAEQKALENILTQYSSMKSLAPPKAKQLPESPATESYQQSDHGRHQARVSPPHHHEEITGPAQKQEALDGKLSVLIH